MRGRAEGSFAVRFALAIGGLIVWAAHFLAVYMAAAVICARGFADVSLLGIGLVPFAVAVATLLALAANLSLARAASADERRHPGRASSPFLRWLALAAVTYSTFAVVIQAYPAFVLPACR